ncbi:MAG: hypothetical protein LBV18_06000 [Alistipes sp.]|jgi:hypothetical protein|nr:hypothetical protein [Alistipes sp.]
MKKLTVSLLTAFVTLSTFTACDDPKPEVEPTTYSIEVTVGDNGSATADPTEAQEGATITLTATADEGYEFSHWMIESGNVTLAEPKATETSFIMPAENVEISAEFALTVGLTVTPPTITIGASEQVASRDIAVEATGEWEIASKPEWVATKNVTETGFSIDVEPWIDGDEEPREGKIVVEMGDLAQEVTLTQHSFFIPYVLSVDENLIENAQDGVDYTIEVTASHAWQVDTAADWITIKNETETGFVINVDPYGDLADPSREGKVVVDGRDTDVEITVVQIKPEPEALPLSAYLGEYTITGTMIDLGGGGDGDAYETTGTMVLRSDMGPNWVSIKVLGVDENFGESEDLFFTYDPTTGFLFNNNYVANTNNMRATSFAYFTNITMNGHETTAHLPIPEGEMALTLNENDEIVVPETWKVDGEDKPVSLLTFVTTTGVTWSFVGVENVVFKKN